MAIEARNLVASFTAQHLEAICRVLADTETGLTGTEIGYLLQDCRIEDTDPALTKWKRLFNAFVHFQNKHQAGNCVIVFITRSMNPPITQIAPMSFRLRRDKLNAYLPSVDSNFAKTVSSSVKTRHRPSTKPGTGQPTSCCPDSASGPRGCIEVLHGGIARREFLPRRF